MNRIKHVLVGIDFSPCSADALRQAMRIAAWSRAQVTALHVEPIPVYASPGGAFVPFEVPPMDMLLSAARERWGGWPPAKAAVGARFEAVVGIPRAELMDSARRGQADLLVVGAHGEHDARAGLGATAAACVQRARAKVLVVRRGQAFRRRRCRRWTRRSGWRRRTGRPCTCCTCTAIPGTPCPRPRA
jgi:universal stress protein E